jgi:hypothetical protein
MSAHKIPCTVQVLTRNNAEGIKKCLDSLTMFAEVIVQDGFSTDGTREAAASYPNVRLMDQNKTYLNDQGRITDFGAMRNESIRVAAHDWIFVVDGDEYVDPQLINEVAEIVGRDNPAVYQAFRRFYIDSEPVMHCSGYPALQIRLFHRTLTEGYVKKVHERLLLNPGVQTLMLKTELPVPLPPAHTLQAKYDRYLAIEVERQGVMAWGKWIKWILLRNLRSAIGLTLRVALIWIIPRKGKKMPLSHEFAYIRHSLRVIAHTFPPRVRALKSKTA